MAAVWIDELKQRVLLLAKQGELGMDINTLIDNQATALLVSMSYCGKITINEAFAHRRNHRVKIV